MMKRIFYVYFAVLIFLSTPIRLMAQQKIDVSPSAPYDKFIIYETLVLLWIGIIGLIVIIKMKLRELERTDKMGLDEEEKDIPFLE